MRRTLSLAVLVGALAALPVLAPGTNAQMATPAASPTSAGPYGVVLQDVDGNDVGTAVISAEPNGWVLVRVEVSGLTEGDHGIHIHEFGVCDPSGTEPFSSAGGHFNPTGMHHGGPPLLSADKGTPTMMATPMTAMPGMATPGTMTGHAGDLGNISVLANGQGILEIETDRFHLADLADGDGSALVIHADPDDLTTDPSGNSGARIACGVISPGQGGTAAATPIG
jgi:Cu-Zn family superoxide dismutase